MLYQCSFCFFPRIKFSQTFRSAIGKLYHQELLLQLQQSVFRHYTFHYNIYLLLKFLNNVIIIQTKVISPEIQLPLVDHVQAFWFACPQTFINYLSFQSFDYERAYGILFQCYLVVSNHFHSVKILLFSSASSRDFDGLIGIELPVLMYTIQTPIDMCHFNVRSST